MRIAIDLTALNPKPSGIDRYLEGMVAALAALESSAEFFLFINAEDRARFSAKRLPAHFRVLPICLRPRVVRLAFQQLLQPLLLYALRIDVLHSPTFIMPLWRARARHVLTIHDMSSFALPHSHPPIRRGRLYECVVSASIRRADFVSVPSASVKEDILRFIPEVGAERIRVIPCGISDVFRPVARRLDLPTPYILFVGTLDPRKNLRVLIDAFGKLVAAGRPEHLVVAGQSGWSPNEWSSSDRIIVPGFVAEEDLPALYSGAALFVYPSLLEGFGFPPLEAIACGVPVVASDTSSLRENLAGAAMLVPADDADAFANAMDTLLRDKGARAAAIAAGMERSRSFSWKRFGEEIFAIYQTSARC